MNNKNNNFDPVNNIEYRNLFAEFINKTDAEINLKIKYAWDYFFYGNDKTERVYYPVGNDMAYIEDVGSNDVRSEGISYGMMIAVQLNKKEEFDRLWKWTKEYMYNEEDPHRGYFAWHCTQKGIKIDKNPAPDGEEWFVTALFFAAGRWGNGDGIFNYQKEANIILDTMLHKTDNSDSAEVTNMFDKKIKQVVFTPIKGRASEFTDPSYHLPHYYELWALWAEKDNDFWHQAAVESRNFFKKAAHPKTGLMPDYSEFSGEPADPYKNGHGDFRFDAWRVAANIAMDYLWFKADGWEVEQSNRWLDFFYKEGIDYYGQQYTLDGKMLKKDHSPGLVSINAVACLAANHSRRDEFINKLWNVDLPSGYWRYYDGLLYFMALLQVSGNFRIYTPPAAF